MITGEIKWTGNLKFVRQILERAAPQSVEREVLMPWKLWVTRRRIPMMYESRGRVPGPDGQPVWKPLSIWTKGQKGTAKNLILSTGRGMDYGTLAGSYNIGMYRMGSHWLMELRNFARSHSKWSPGFDYPSALHTGWGDYYVRPRPGGPGVLVIPFLGSVGPTKVKKSQATGLHAIKAKGAYVWVNTFVAGRAKKVKARGNKLTKTGKRVQRTTATYETGLYFRMMTHPKGAPPRPHIKFFYMDAIELATRTVEWALLAKRTPPPITLQKAA